MKIRYHGEIKYTMDRNHPDIQYAKDWTKDKLYSFSDTYEFDCNYYSTEEIMAYIVHDLKLVAGGGYNSKHIHNLAFEIKQV